MPLRSGLICARLTGSARHGMGGIVTLGSGTLPAGVPPRWFAAAHYSHSDSRS
jgi:hypothetical protein